MELKAEVYQFLSRSNIQNISLGTSKAFLLQRSDITVEIEFSICDKPFEINFANVIGQRPSIGAFQYIDPYIDQFMSKRWPKCINGKAKINCNDSDIKENKVLDKILIFLRFLTWDLKNNPNCNSIIYETIDQRATTSGYRREYICGQLFDFEGNRVPNSNERYFSSKVGDYTGPGFTYIFDIIPFKNINELVWSSIIPFRNRLNIEIDSPILKGKIDAIRKHFNSYDELEDAKKLFKQGNIKSSIRSAASSIDAILRYYCIAWDTKFPKGDLQFDSKIENILSRASKPSYKYSDPDNLTKLLYLYRARNSMHEGDCYYKNNSNEIVYIKNLSQVDDFIKAAEFFIIWIDSLV